MIKSTADKIYIEEELGGRHPLVLAKVNAFVDEGIAELVMALSRFPRVETMMGCQAGEHLIKSGECAVVEFQYHGPRGGWEETAKFALWLFEELQARDLGEDGAYVSLACAPHFNLNALIFVEPEAMERVVREIHAIASRWEASPEMIDKAIKTKTLEPVAPPRENNEDNI